MTPRETQREAYRRMGLWVFDWARRIARDEDAVLAEIVAVVDGSEDRLKALLTTASGCLKDMVILAASARSGVDLRKQHGGRYTLTMEPGDDDPAFLVVAQIVTAMCNRDGEMAYDLIVAHAAARGTEGLYASVLYAIGAISARLGKSAASGEGSSGFGKP